PILPLWSSRCRFVRQPLLAIGVYEIHRFIFSICWTSPRRYTLSLHDALPICFRTSARRQDGSACDEPLTHQRRDVLAHGRARHRSEEHTSELQSRENLVCRLLLEKKKSKQ